MPTEQPPRLVAGRLLLCEEFASGGMAALHFGRLLGAAGFARTVAVKRLHAHLARDPEFVAMFVDEATLAARIRHPNVVATLDVVQDEDELLLVLEYVEGESLAGLVRAARRLGERVPIDIALRVVCDVLSGLHAAHEAASDTGTPLHIVHRDVSPSNVMVGVDGSARVLDFGIAKAAVRISATREGGMKGKLRYLSPEQVADQEVTRRTDIYATAVMLWELLTGEALFTGSNDAAIMARIMQGVVPPPSRKNPNVAPALDEAVLRGLAREPATRFSTARAFACELEAAHPAASAHAVAEWVGEVAGDWLATRSAALARAEAGLASTGAAAPPLEEAEGTTQLATTRRAALAAGRARTAVVAASVLLGAGTIAAVVIGALGPGAPSTAAADASTGALAQTSPPVDAAPSQSDASAAEARMVEPLGEDAGGPSPDATTSRSSTRAGTSGAVRPRPTGKPDCSVPYVVDADGRRRVKRECL